VISFSEIEISRQNPDGQSGRTHLLVGCLAGSLGRAAAIKRGTKLGRKSKLDDHQQKGSIKRLKAGESCRAMTSWTWKNRGRR
jgi:hypothetical protein